MTSKIIGRRVFIKAFSSIFFGIATHRILKVRSSLGKSGNKPALEYRNLGRTGLKVTAVGMGVMNCSDPSVLRRAFDLGVNFYDTADCYMHGRNEEMIGEVFQGRRDRVLIQTKVHDNDEKKMRASVERSLRRLRTDYIDVLVWHNIKTPKEVSDERLFEFMSKMKKEGKARFTGFSSHSHMALLLREAAKLNYHDVALVSYNFTHSKDLREAVALAAKSGIGIIAMKTQAGGYKKEKMGGLTPHQAALKYILMDQNVSTTIPGVTTIEQIEECVKVMGNPFTLEDQSLLKQYYAFLRGRICTMCGGCLGECPYGVPHQDLLRWVMYHEGYDNVSLLKESLLLNPEPNIQYCLDCSSCSIRCRQGLDLRSKIQQVQWLIVQKERPINENLS
ncbi:MAG: aldo/keto reductase [Thermodesulfobacteriota bacterium]